MVSFVFGEEDPTLFNPPLSLSLSALCVVYISIHTGNTVKDITHSCLCVIVERERGMDLRPFLPLAHTGNGADGSVEEARQDISI
jgi:hypothetical protein